ncbi:MAG: c-type cytochrome domain-containing protein, partial [Cyclobacteriaceae bacterium]
MFKKSGNFWFKYFIYQCSFSVLAIFLISCQPDLPTEVDQAYQELPEVIDYNFHVKPIISDRCYACHGPDKETRKAGLRLDIEENAFAALE